MINAAFLRVFWGIAIFLCIVTIPQRLHGMCVYTEKPQALVATMEACESVKPEHLLKYFDNSFGMYGDQEKLVAGLILNQPGVILTLKPLRVREYEVVYETGSDYQHIRWLTKWKSVQNRTRERFFYPGDSDACKKISPKQTVLFFIEVPCCDFNVHERIVCILDEIPSVVKTIYSTSLED